MEAGTVLDHKYEIRGRLGGGGMGDIYLARRTFLGDDVALKVVRPSGPDPEIWRARFLRESRACAQLRHPYIVSILDFSIDDAGQPYLVMEYLNGPSLAEELRSRGRFGLTDVRRLLESLGAALQLAHTHGIVHRDLKPQNVVSHRYASGEVVRKIIDFGLANMRAAEDETTPLTRAHEFLGTVSYAAPEQFSGEPVTAAADQYSLGVIVYEMLAGVRPFDGDGFMVLADRHLNAPPTPLPTHCGDLPPDVVHAVMRALAKAPDERWPSVAAFVRAVCGDDDETTRPVSVAAASSLLGIYELGPVIARGRFGSAVHSGVHRALGHPVAIRLFRRPGTRDAVRDRFLREARALQVPHPNIIQVRDFGEDADTVYVVTDLLAGSSLAEHLERTGPLPLEHLDRFILQVADATAALHRRGGRICGLHPGIIRVVESGDGEGDRVAISSAGICQIQDLLSTLDEAALRSQATDETELLYIAPELLTGKPATEQSDVYTIGVLGYEMATGRTPYDSTTAPDLLGAMLDGPPRDPAALRPELGERRASCLLRCLARSPRDRFATPGELIAAWRERS